MDPFATLRGVNRPLPQRTIKLGAYPSIQGEPLIDPDEALADELLALAAKWGEELGRQRLGDAWGLLPKGPDITHLLRSDLLTALRADRINDSEGVLPVTITLSAETVRWVKLWAAELERQKWELREWPPGQAALAAIHILIERAE